MTSKLQSVNTSPPNVLTFLDGNKNDEGPSHEFEVHLDQIPNFSFILYCIFLQCIGSQEQKKLSEKQNAIKG